MPKVRQPIPQRELKPGVVDAPGNDEQLFAPTVVTISFPLKPKVPWLKKEEAGSASLCLFVIAVCSGILFALTGIELEASIAILCMVLSCWTGFLWFKQES